MMLQNYMNNKGDNEINEIKKRSIIHRNSIISERWNYIFNLVLE